MREFVSFLKEQYDGKTIGIVEHRTPQLSLEVITKELVGKKLMKRFGEK